MKFISLLLSLKIVYSQLQVNLIKGQPFYYNLEKDFNTNGYDLQIMSPNLGLSIQGGLTQGPLNTNINVNQIVSTSLLQEYNTIITLKQIGSLYYIELVQYDYQGIIGTPLTLFNITSVNQACQDIEILEDLLIIVHCINTTNNQIQLYNYNDTIITTQYFSFNLTNYTQVTSVDIQSYYNMEQYDLYFVYITKLSSFIYYTTLTNNTYSAPQLVWTYNASFLQIFISNDQEIFALQFNYLLYQFQGQQTNYSSQNKSNWIAMTIQYDYQDDFLIYLVNNYTITELFFLDQFYLIDEQFLPIQIKSAQMLSTYDNIFVLTSSYALVYGFQDDEYMIFSQFAKNNFINANNLISSQQNILISFSSSGVQIYQLLDYALISKNPQNSGYLVINYYNLNGSIVFNSTLYIYILSSYQNQIMPTVYGLQAMNYYPENANFVNFNVGQYFVGSNISYYLNSTNLSGTSQFFKSINEEINSYLCDNALISALDKFNSYLFLCSKSNEFKIVLSQYLQFSDTTAQIFDATTQFQTNSFAFIGLDNETDLFLAFSYQQIYVYNIQIDVNYSSLYSIDLANILGIVAFTVQNYVVIDNLIFLQLNQSYVILGIYNTYFEVIEIGNQTFNQVSGIQYDQNYLFVTNNDALDIYVWYRNGLQLYQSQEYQESGGISQIFVYPLIDGLFILIVSNGTQLFYSDKSIMKTVNLGQTFLIPVDTTNFTLNQSSTAYSSVFFYIHAISNNNNYINIYQCNQQQIGTLYYSKWVNNIPQNITISTAFVQKMDYLSVYLGDGYSIYLITHSESVFQFPYFQLSPSYSYLNNFVLNNSYSQALFQMTIIVNQLYMYIENTYLNTTINGNLSDGSLTFNPYDYFSGAIQDYNVSCNNCQSIQYQPIISNQYLYCNTTVYFSLSQLYNNSFQLYLSDEHYLNYTTINNTNNQTTQSINLSTLAYYPNDVFFIFMFFEVNTNSITWIVQNGSTFYICTILPNTNQIINITIPGLEYSDQQSFTYSNGYLQIIQQYYYSCYYYQIVNSTQLITTIVSPIIIQQQSEQPFFSLLSIEITPQYEIFGCLSQTMTNIMFSIIINVTQIGNNSFVLNYYNVQYLQQFDSFQQLFTIQYIFQFGDAVLENGVYNLMLAYTNAINSGIIQLQIKDYQVLNFQEKCTLQLFNQKTLDILNMMDLYENQISILQYSPEKDVNNLVLSIYYVDVNNCNYEQIIQPYSYKVFDNQQAQMQSVNYLNNNNLLISLNDMAYIYEINDQINVEFNSSQNSSIQVTAYNTLYNQSQQINIYYTETQQVIINTTHSFAWYWILLITLVCLLIIMLLIWFFFYRNKGQQPGSYQQYKEETEIEIKSAKKNDNISIQ